MEDNKRDKLFLFVSKLSLNIYYSLLTLMTLKAMKILRISEER
jgi:hypothetical protein